MITKNQDRKGQLQVVSLDQLVPEDHILRKIDKYVDFSFIYDLVEEKYSPDNGRPSLDPVMLIKIPMIEYLFGISSMRQTIKDIEVNMAYRWFLGLDFFDPVPHFTTFGKNYKRRFEGTDLFEQIFTNILLQCMSKGLVDTKTAFVDATHVKAAANRKKANNILVAKKTAKFYDQKLKEEIDKDREMHGKKPLKDDGDDQGNGGSSGPSDDSLKEMKVSTTDPESGWFHKGEHKEVFAYSIETACDQYGWIMGYSVHPGNEHDSTTFPAIYEKLKSFDVETLVADSGYKTPAIAKLLIDDGITPIFPYKSPMTKKGFFKKKEFQFDRDQECYVCPMGEKLKYSTTDRNGYREYKSDPKICEGCPCISQCTLGKNHQKLVMRHIWEDYLEACEEVRHTKEGKETYEKRKETIERVFGTAKERHGLRYTNQIGKDKMAMKVGLTFACMNMKKLARILARYDRNTGHIFNIFGFLRIKFAF